MVCIVTFLYQFNPEYPLILVQNRDEAYDRKSQPIHFWNDFPDVLAGIDSLHGGTWAGITKTGRLASLTNRPFEDFSALDSTLSRGKLVKDYLTKTQSLEAFLKQLRSTRYSYDSYQLIFGSIDNLQVYSNATNDHRLLQPGLYSLSNTEDDLSQHKTTRAAELVGNYLNRHPQADLDVLITLFNDKKKAEALHHYPDHIPSDVAKNNSSIFIEGETYGTVNTTALMVHKSGKVTLKEVRYNQAGPLEATEEMFQMDATD